MKIKIDKGAGIGLVPNSLDLGELVDPFHAWESADAALEANLHRVSPRAGSGADLSPLENDLAAAVDALEEQFTTWMDADTATALGKRLISVAEELRRLQWHT